MASCFDIDYIDRLTRLAFQFGPYLFTVVLLVVGLTAIKRSDPQQSPRLTWLLVLFSLAMVTATSGYWMYYQFPPTRYLEVYRGTIYNIPLNDRINAVPGDDLFLVEMGNGDYQFVLVTNKPMAADRVIPLSWISKEVVRTDQAGGYGGTKLLFNFSVSRDRYMYYVRDNKAQIMPLDSSN